MPGLIWLSDPDTPRPTTVGNGTISVTIHSQPKRVPYKPVESSGQIGHLSSLTAMHCGFPRFPVRRSFGLPDTCPGLNRSEPTQFATQESEQTRC